MADSQNMLVTLQFDFSKRTENCNQTCKHGFSFSKDEIQMEGDSTLKHIPSKPWSKSKNWYILLSTLDILEKK